MFTRKEHSYFLDPYFRIIREEDQYKEVQSVCTGHCWNIFKNQFESVYKVTLYHKHKESDQYYHQHRKCRSVAEALQEIKHHDEYALAQLAQKEKQKASAQKKERRQLKVYTSSGYNYKPTPMIMLKGDWLRNCGFEPGAKVNIVCEADRKLTISATD